MMKNAPVKDVETYIALQPEHVRPILAKLQLTIKKAAPKADENISYQMPAYKYYGALIYFAVWKNHIGFYPTGRGIEAFKKELSAYEGSKGTVKFPLDKPIPFGLISKIVKFRAKENLEKNKKKKQK